MVTFYDWLQAEMLRLRSFDWQNGLWEGRDLDGGGMRFTSHYRLAAICDLLGVSDQEILRELDSDATKLSIEDRGFAIHYDEASFRLLWIEQGIQTTRTDYEQQYSEEQKRYYVQSRIQRRIKYLDGDERVVSDSGWTRAEISQSDFEHAIDRIRRSNPE